MNSLRILLAILLLGSLAACTSKPSGDGGGDALRIAVIPKGTTHEFWKSIHAGAVKAERELEGVEDQRIERIRFGSDDREVLFPR